MSTPTIPSRPVLMAAALLLLNIAVGLGPIDTAHPAQALVGAILYLVVGGLFIASVFAPAQLRSFSINRLVSGSAIFGIGLLLLGQASALLNTNVFLAGAFYAAGAFLLLIGI